MKIFCFPYAGGSSFMYFELKKRFIEEIKIVPMEYPGHGIRMREELSESVEVIVDDMFRQIQMNDDGSSFAILGYSLGSKLIYLLYQKYKNKPMFRRMKCMIFCAMTMSDSEKEKDYSLMSDKELMNYTLSLGGSDLKSDEDYECYLQFLPIIRNDFILFEKTKKYILDVSAELISKDVFVLYSSDEKNIKEYDNYCDNVLNYHYFDGGHFFINHHVDEMAEHIKNCLERYFIIQNA